MDILENIDPSWTLFLDRDGVLNEEKHLDYIKNVAELKLYDGVVDAMRIFATLFARVVIVTNQKGIGKGLMTTTDLNAIHDSLRLQIELGGGQIDAIYYCADVADDSPYRKPQCGMAYQAQQQFSEIDFSKSIMVGNRLSDMGFARNAGMHSVFLATTHPEVSFPHPNIDFRFNSLIEFATAL
jgi:D-glycero-D-manno-heptose 1,7-bisphosphate phosphatase